MAKIKCKSCGDMIDDGVKFCAHCGTEVGSKDGQRFVINFLILIAAFLVIAFSCDGKKKEGEKTSPTVVAEASVGESIADEIINEPKVDEVKKADLALNMPLKWWIAEVNKSLKNVSMPGLKRGKKGGCDVFCVDNYSVGKFVNLMVSYRDDKIDSVMVFASSDGSVKAFNDISVVNMVLGQVFSPNTPKKELTLAIFNAVTDSISNKNLQTLSFDGVRYVYKTSTELGFIATVAKDN